MDSSRPAAPPPSRNRIRKSPGELLFDATNHLFMVVLAFITLYPFWYIGILSLNDGLDAQLGGIWFWPRMFTWSNYGYVLTNPLILNAYVITVLRTAIGSLWSLVITGIAAFALTKKHLVLRNAILTFFLIPMFIGGTVVSNYVIYAKVGLLNNFLVYIIPGGFAFFNMIIMRTYFYGLPVSMEESAKMDGASYTRIFFQIVVPLSMPIIATMLLFNGVGHWLDFYTNLVYVSKKSLWTLQYLLYKVVRESQTNIMTDESAAKMNQYSYLKRPEVTPNAIKMATLMVVTLPILFVYPFLQKYFIKGVLLGAVKE
jgi:putative aldouronate transport system permease protein